MVHSHCRGFSADPVEHMALDEVEGSLPPVVERKRSRVVEHTGHVVGLHIDARKDRLVVRWDQSLARIEQDCRQVYLHLEHKHPGHKSNRRNCCCDVRDRQGIRRSVEGRIDCWKDNMGM